MLRIARAWVANRLAVSGASSRSRERMVIALGQRAIRTSYWLGTLYTHTLDQICNLLRAKDDVYRTMAIGPLTLELDVTGHFAKEEYFYGTAHRYEPALVDYVMASIREGDVCLDIGANAGFFSLIAAKCAGPGGRVIAFEPHPEARVGLERLMEINGVSARVTVAPCAIADEIGTTRLHLADDTVLSTLEPARSPLVRYHSFDRTIEVEVTTVDEWLRSRPELIQRISFVKIDVEGCEERVVAGMGRLLREVRNLRVVCETTPASPVDAQLTALGFSQRLLDRYEGECVNYAYERER